MTTQEHLTAIRAKCVDLLATAKLRTPGKWRAVEEKAILHFVESTYTVDGPPGDFMFLENKNDADFIASCAGPAEAGWSATIAAIDTLPLIVSSYSHNTEAHAIATEAIDTIITAWPEELLK